MVAAKIVRTCYAFYRKIATGMNISFAFENIYQINLFNITFLRAGSAVQGPLVVNIKLGLKKTPT